HGGLHAIDAAEARGAPDVTPEEEVAPGDRHRRVHLPFGEVADAQHVAAGGLLRHGPEPLAAAEGRDVEAGKAAAARDAEVLELADAEALVALTRRARLLVVGAARAAGHGIRGRRVRVAELEAVAEDAVVAVRVARAAAAAGDDRRARLGGREP